MRRTSDTHADVIAYWNERANLGELAGTNDLSAKRIEMRVLLENIPKHAKVVVDAGCGNGMTLAYLATRLPNVQFIGLDNAPNMVEAAKAYMAEQGLCNVEIRNGSVLDTDLPACDVVYTERVLINLPSVFMQQVAMSNLCNSLKHNGQYLMLENSADGLDQINHFRHAAGLDTITQPWHNIYIRDKDVDAVRKDIGGIADVVRIVDYSSTYYFVSRVCAAVLANAEGKKPEYGNVLSLIAEQMPPLESPKFVGQGRLWIWQKR